jgi:hypothetical protein
VRVHALAGAAVAVFGVVIAVSARSGIRPGQLKAEEVLESSTPVPHFVADGTGRAGYRPSDRELATWAIAAWQRHAGGELRFVPAPETDALVRLY